MATDSPNKNRPGRAMSWVPAGVGSLQRQPIPTSLHATNSNRRRTGSRLPIPVLALVNINPYRGQICNQPPTAVAGRTYENYPHLFKNYRVPANKQAGTTVTNKVGVTTFIHIAISFAYTAFYLLMEKR